MRHGRYLKSIFNIPGFGVSRWVVGCYVEIDYARYAGELSELELVGECISYLNEPPPREKFQRTPKEPLYGNLELYAYRLKDVGGKRFIELELVTDDQKNENFWGEGIKLDTGRKNRSSKNRRVS